MPPSRNWPPGSPTATPADDPVADKIMLRVAAGEKLHMMFYRDIVAARPSRPGPTRGICQDRPAGEPIPGRTSRQRHRQRTLCGRLNRRIKATYCDDLRRGGCRGGATPRLDQPSDRPGHGGSGGTRCRLVMRHARTGRSPPRQSAAGRRTTRPLAGTLWGRGGAPAMPVPPRRDYAGEADFCGSSGGIGQSHTATRVGLLGLIGTPGPPSCLAC